MSGGKSSGSSVSPYAQVLANIAEQVNAEVNPLRKLYLAQLTDVLKGHMFTNSAMPLIQSGVAAARQAGASSLEGAQRYMAQSGVAQSPFAAGISSLINQGATQNIGNVPIDVSTAMLGNVNSAASNFTQSAMSGLSSAMQGNMQTSSNNLSGSLQGLGFGKGGSQGTFLQL